MGQIVTHAPQVRRRIGSHIILEGFHRRLHRRQRGAQVVTDGRQQLFALLLRSLQPLHHLVEGPTRPPQLVAPVYPRAHREVPIGNGAGGA